MLVYFPPLSESPKRSPFVRVNWRKEINEIQLISLSERNGLSQV